MTELIRRIANGLQTEDFVLVDVGCSGGIAEHWRRLGDKLRGVGFDPRGDEIERLRALEQNDKFAYEHAYIRSEEGLSLTGDRFSSLFPIVLPYGARTSAFNLRAKLDQKMRAEPDDSAGPKAPAHYTTVPRYLESQNYQYVDFLKTDTDGFDFEIINGFGENFSKYSVMGALIEVNYQGSDDPNVDTFHNVDRFMRKHGYELYDLEVRRYSTLALPDKFLFDIPAQTVSGKPLQGDALYVRDLCRDRMEGRDWPVEKVLKACVIFATHRIPDAAAELILAYREELAPLIDVEGVLNELAKKTVLGRQHNWDYDDVTRAFEQSPEQFYNTEREKPILKRMGRAVKKRWREIRHALLGW